MTGKAPPAVTVRPPADHHVGMEPLSRVLVGLEGEGDAGIAPKVVDLLLVREERRKDDLVAVEPGPREAHVRCAVGAERHDVRERSGCEEVANGAWDRRHEGKCTAAFRLPRPRFRRSTSSVPPAGLEPALPAPEAGALSAELRGRAERV